MAKIKKFAYFLGLLIFGVLIGSTLTEAASLKTTFPKRANYFLSWDMTDRQAEELARFDLLILDMEIQNNARKQLQKIRTLNPQIVILAYVTSQEIRRDALSLGSISPLRKKLYERIPSEWWLTDAQDRQLSWWLGTWLVNVTDDTPIVGEKRWNEFLPEFMKTEVLSTGLWDGIFYDNAWEGISSFVGADVDINRDGRAEDTTTSDEHWRVGMRHLYTYTRHIAGDSILLVGNGSERYTDLNGVLFENFPTYGWGETLSKYRSILRDGRKPTLGIINANTENKGDETRYQDFRFGYTSALLDDGYYSYDFGDTNHGQVWWYDEYDVPLGTPLNQSYSIEKGSSDFQSRGIWRRDFSNGVVLVNSGEEGHVVALEEEYQKIDGVQDSLANDGLRTSYVPLSAEDGVVLLKTNGIFESQKIPVGLSVDNGNFARLVLVTDTKAATGFFTYDGRFPGGVQIHMEDMDGDAVPETIVSDETYVRIYSAEGKVKAEFAPYTASYTGGVIFTIGNIDGKGDKEIITGTRPGGGPHVRVFSVRGKLYGGFFAFPKDGRGGVSVATGDMNGDGTDEIIVGAGKGNTPQVRIFDKNGQLFFSPFFAFSKGMRGGVSVAAADVVGDAGLEIIVGSGKGISGTVRIFSSAGILIGSPLSVSSSKAGIQVGVADTDTDGKSEIVVMTKGAL